MFKSLNGANTSTSNTAVENTEALILQTALELFRERGFEVTTMRDIGQAAKVATGAAYYYFTSKEAIAEPGLSEELRQLLPTVLWLAHLGMILSLIYDQSEGQQKTHKLVDGVLDLFIQAIEWTSSALVRPFVQPFQAKVLHMLQDAGWA